MHLFKRGKKINLFGGLIVTLLKVSMIYIQGKLKLLQEVRG